jgi:hypothetical protein
MVGARLSHGEASITQKTDVTPEHADSFLPGVVVFLASPFLLAYGVPQVPA